MGFDPACSGLSSSREVSGGVLQVKLSAARLFIYQLPLPPIPLANIHNLEHLSSLLVSPNPTSFHRPLVVFPLIRKTLQTWNHRFVIGLIWLAPHRIVWSLPATKSKPICCCSSSLRSQAPIPNHPPPPGHPLAHLLIRNALSLPPQPTIAYFFLSADQLCTHNRLTFLKAS